MLSSDDAVQLVSERLDAEVTSSEPVLSRVPIDLDLVIESLCEEHTDPQDRYQLNAVLGHQTELLHCAREWGASVMTWTSASAVVVFEVDGPFWFLGSPGDADVGIPPNVWASSPAGDWAVVFRRGVEVMVASWASGYPPMGSGPLPDTIRVHSEFPKHLLHPGFARLFESREVADEAISILVRYGQDLPRAKPDGSYDPHQLAGAFVELATA